MVRRRSTVRFRKGAPGQRRNSKAAILWGTHDLLITSRCTIGQAIVAWRAGRHVITAWRRGRRPARSGPLGNDGYPEATEQDQWQERGTVASPWAGNGRPGG